MSAAKERPSLSADAGRGAVAESLEDPVIASCNAWPKLVAPCTLATFECVERVAQSATIGAVLKRVEMDVAMFTESNRRWIRLHLSHQSKLSA